MSIYGTGAEAFRDATKWLVAFVPLTTIVAGGAVIGPRLVSDLVASLSLWAWAASSVWLLVGIGVVAAGVVLVVWFGAEVLSAQPQDFTQLLRDETKLSEAFRAGVGAPYFLDDSAFRSAMADLDATWSSEQPVEEKQLARTVAATEMLRAWAFHRALSQAFGNFRRAFGVAVALIIFGFALALTGIEPAAGTINEPTVVDVSVNHEGRVDLKKITGCTTPGQTEFLAVAGTWDAPALRVSGPGCQFAAKWQPSADVFDLRLPAEK
jgi:hypothetical protein